MLKIKNIIILDNYELEIAFESGEVKIFDLKPYFEEENVFSVLKNENNFKNVANRGYFIEWMNAIDLSSETVYHEGKFKKYSAA